MKKILTSALVAFMAITAISSCKKEEEKVIVRDVKVTPSTLSMKAGETQALAAEVTPSNATDKTITWKSSKEEVATVSADGVVTAVSGGICTITAKSGSKSGTCEVTVKGPATGITISPESADLGYAESITVTAVLTPEGYVDEEEVKNVKWTNEKDDIVTITPDASNPLAVKIVAGKTKGSSKVTVSTKDGKFSASCTANVIGVSDKGLKTADEVLAFIENAGSLSATDDVKLAADIDFGGKNIPQIPVEFKATFNGQNFSFKNAVITDAIFATNNGTVKNLVIDNSCRITPTTGEFAPIVLVNNGIVSGCVNNANISYSENNDQYVLVGGVVAANTRDASVEACINNGLIEIKCGGAKTMAPTVAGVVGVSAGNVRTCENNGDINHEVGCAALGKGGIISEYVIGGKINVPHHTAGVVGLFFNSDQENKKGLTDRGVESCKNKGAVTAVAPCGLPTASCRPYVAGIAGTMAGGYIKNCENTGKVFLNSDSGTGAITTGNKQHFCGGIYCVNQNDFTIAAGCTYPTCTSCINRGDITMITDSNDGYQYVGGIASQMDMETPVSIDGTPTPVLNEMNGCENYGKVLAGGYGKTRAAGICGGTGKFVNCKNFGTVELAKEAVASANSGSFAGGISCYHKGDEHAVINCEVNCEIILNAANQMAGGFIGVLGPVPTSEISGKCICTMKGPEGSYLGMLTGYCNANDNWIAGTAEHPMYIGGKIVKGETTTELNADNFKNYLIAWDKSDGTKHPWDFTKYSNK